MYRSYIHAMLLGATFLRAPEGAAGAPVDPATVDPSYIAKLTPSRLCNPHKGLVTNDDGTPKPGAVLMCEIFGTVRELKTKKLPNVDVGTALVGDFEGVNSATGEIKRSGYCYLPSGIQDVLVSAVKAAGGDKIEKPIGFGLALYIRAAKNPAGYEWDCKKIYKEEAVDPLSEMRKQIAASRQPAQPALTDATAAANKKK